MTHKPTLLTSALHANAIFSGASGMLLVVLPGWWAALFGVLPASAYATLGAGLLGFAGIVWWTARGIDARRPLVNGILAADTLWVLATPVVMLLAAGTMRPTGHLLLVAVALAVALLAMLQWLGLRRLPECPPPLRNSGSE